MRETVAEVWTVQCMQWDLLERRVSRNITELGKVEFGGGLRSLGP